MTIETILQAVQAGTLSIEDAATQLQDGYFEDLGHTVVDHNRELRTGSPEVIYGLGKSAQQIAEIYNALHAQAANILVTRLDQDKYLALQKQLNGDHRYHADAGLLTCINTPPEPAAHTVAVVTAGTSDQAVAEEAAITAEFYGHRVERIYDVGVAGLHRLLARLPDLQRARVLIVVAGMEGALPSVVGGLVDKPVIAVPTSVGYGAAFGGMTAMMGMLTSCASGVSVVNIDNGFGAGYLANTINRL